jgi:hypothetical protein
MYLPLLLLMHHRIWLTAVLQMGGAIEQNNLRASSVECICTL